MKLRNKKTGEIWDIGKVLTNDYPSLKMAKNIPSPSYVERRKNDKHGIIYIEQR